MIWPDPPLSFAFLVIVLGTLVYLGIATFLTARELHSVPIAGYVRSRCCFLQRLYLSCWFSIFESPPNSVQGYAVGLLGVSARELRRLRSTFKDSEPRDSILIP